MKKFNLILAACALVIVLLFPSQAFANEAILPVSVKLVQCGPVIEKACERDSRCCALMGARSIEIALNHERSEPASYGHSSGFASISGHNYTDLGQYSRTAVFQ